MAKQGEGSYTGPVCFLDGWHYTVVTDGAGNDAPGERLVTDGDGSYRPATDADTSHNDRHATGFVDIALEDGAPGARVTPDEFEAVQQFLRERRGE